MKTRKNLSTPLASTCFRGSSSPSCSCACLYCWKLISSLVISPSIFVFTFPASSRLHSWRLPFPSRALSPDFHAIRQPMPARSDSFADFGFFAAHLLSGRRFCVWLTSASDACQSIPHFTIFSRILAFHYYTHLVLVAHQYVATYPFPHLSFMLRYRAPIYPRSVRTRSVSSRSGRSSRPGTSRGCGPWPSAPEVGRAAGVTRARRVSKFADCSRSGRPGPSQVQLYAQQLTDLTNTGLPPCANPLPSLRCSDS